MAARAYRRATNDEIREAERSRTVGLLALRGGVGVDDRRVNGWIAAGVSVADARAELQREDDERRLQAAAEVRQVPDGDRLSGAAGTCAALLMMGRPDLADRHADSAHTPRVSRFRLRAARDGFERLLGAAGPGLDVWRAGLDMLEAATVTADRAALAGGFYQAGALPAGSLGAALRNAAQIVIADNWERSGSFWRAACRLVPVSTFKTTRVWFTRSGDVAASALAEGGGPRRASDASSEAWPWVDIDVASDVFDSTLVLTRERAVNAGDGGMAEIGAFIAAQIAGWHDRLDREVVSALAAAPSSSPVAAISAAIGALNRQTIGDMTLGSGRRPWALAGENRRTAVQALLPTSADDQSALLEGASFSSAVAADTLILVHGAFRPCALGHWSSGGEGTGEIVPRPAFGRAAGAPMPGSQGRVLSPAGVRVQFDAGTVKAIHVGPAPETDSIVGAVRLTAESE